MVAAIAAIEKRKSRPAFYRFSNSNPPWSIFGKLKDLFLMVMLITCCTMQLLEGLRLKKTQAVTFVYHLPWNSPPSQWQGHDFSLLELVELDAGNLEISSLICPSIASAATTWLTAGVNLNTCPYPRAKMMFGCFPNRYMVNYELLIWRDGILAGNCV